MTPTVDALQMTKKERLLSAFRFAKVDRPPVWLMRQAGRYLPEYQTVRANYSFLEMCRKPEVAAEVSIQPLDILDVDAVIVFNDILIPLESMGREVIFTENGPVIQPAFREPKELESIQVCTYDETPAVFDSIQTIRRHIGNDVPILGFAGAPFTMAAYLVEGKMSKNLQHIKSFLYSEPDALKSLLEKITETVIGYLKIQVQAGADAVQIFDTWGGSLTQADYQEFALPFQQRVIEEIAADGTPVTLYVNGSTPYLKAMKESGATALSVDWRVDLNGVAQIVGKKAVLQGNLDPTLLFANAEIVYNKTKDMLSNINRKEGYIANLGHGVLPGTPVESVKAFVEAVKDDVCHCSTA